jgi:hypothetical protein
MLLAALATGFAGCGSAGVGLDECRSVENARCSAAAHCDLGLTSTAKVEQCTQFARDNCLHGLLAPPPHPGTVDRCLHAIQAAGNCARRLGGETHATNCPGLLGSFATPETTTVCDVIDAPDLASECAFLTTTPVVEQPDATTPVVEHPKDAGAD